LDVDRQEHGVRLRDVRRIWIARYRERRAAGEIAPRRVAYGERDADRADRGRRRRDRQLGRPRVCVGAGRPGDHAKGAAIADQLHAWGGDDELIEDRSTHDRVDEAHRPEDLRIEILGHHRLPSGGISPVNDRRRATTGSPSGTMSGSIRTTRAMYDRLR